MGWFQQQTATEEREVISKDNFHEQEEKDLLRDDYDILWYTDTVNGNGIFHAAKCPTN